jgi:dienelactone hydrolase
LIVYDDVTLAEWMRTNTRHLASIGYVVLAVSVHERRRVAEGPGADEAALAQLSAAIRWLRGRSEVSPERVGVLGWGWGGLQALALASSAGVQACVVCDCPLPSDAALIRGLRATPLQGVFGGADPTSQKPLAEFRKRLAAEHVSATFHVAEGAQAGFLGPPKTKTYAHDAAEDAWVIIYHFLEKHVEDARPRAAAIAGNAEPPRPVATVADIMRAVIAPAGIRGGLSKALDQPPKDDRAWLRVRANAALIAEAGALLQARKPPQGPLDHWRQRTRAFTEAAEVLVTAAEQKDYPGTQRGLVLLSEQCTPCHDMHR